LLVPRSGETTVVLSVIVGLRCVGVGWGASVCGVAVSVGDGVDVWDCYFVGYYVVGGG